MSLDPEDSSRDDRHDQHHDGSHAVVAYIVRTMTCQSCGTPYGEQDVTVALRRSQRTLLNATCPTCHTETTITAYDQPPYHWLRPQYPLVTSRVTASDCADWSEFLTRFDGDMLDLLAEET